VLSHGKVRVGVLGLSFKGDTDDLRESPMVDVVESLLGKGYQIRIYDRNVRLAKLFGANKKFINEKIPHISNLIVEIPEELLRESDLLIIGNNAPGFKDIVKASAGRHKIVDFVRIVKELTESDDNYEGLCW